MTEATKALQGVDSGALAAQYRQCSAWARGLKSMEMNTKESAFNMFCPFCWFLSPAVTVNGILTLASKKQVSRRRNPTYLIWQINKKFNLIKLAFIRFFTDNNWGNHGKSV
jgi:hypothetical protein